MVSEPHRFARSLRKGSTSAEDILWARLRGSRIHGAKFKRQVPVDRYVVDFSRHAARLVVEIDGRQHEWQSPYDDVRTRTLESAGFQVARFTNEEVRDDLEGVLRKLAEELRLPFDEVEQPETSLQTLTPDPSPEQERGGRLTRARRPRPQ